MSRLLPTSSMSLNLSSLFSILCSQCFILHIFFHLFSRLLILPSALSYLSLNPSTEIFTLVTVIWSSRISTWLLLILSSSSEFLSFLKNSKHNHLSLFLITSMNLLCIFLLLLSSWVLLILSFLLHFVNFLVSWCFCESVNGKKLRTRGDLSLFLPDTLGLFSGITLVWFREWDDQKPSFHSPWPWPHNSSLSYNFPCASKLNFFFSI